MQRNVVVVDELAHVERSLAKAGIRTTKLESTTAPPKQEPLTRGARGRLRLMYAALKQGLEFPAGTEWWSALSPLKATERVGVRKEVARLLALSPEDRSAELLLLRAQGGL